MGDPWWATGGLRVSYGWGAVASGGYVMPLRWWLCGCEVLATRRAQLVDSDGESEAPSFTRPTNTSMSGQGRSRAKGKAKCKAKSKAKGEAKAKGKAKSTAAKDEVSLGVAK